MVTDGDKEHEYRPNRYQGICYKWEFYIHVSVHRESNLYIHGSVHRESSLYIHGSVHRESNLYIHGSVHRESNLITVQQDATYSVYCISVDSSTCFGC